MATPTGNPARSSSLREHNLALVLARVADHGPASRARIAAASGLTKATVSTLVDALVTGGLLAELGPQTGPVPAGVGRPGSRIGFATPGPVGIGLEINVDYLATCTVDLAGTVRARQLIADDFRRARRPNALARAATAVRRAVTEARASGARVAGVAVAVPGLVETDRHLLRLAPNLGWRDVAVLDELRAAGALTADPDGATVGPVSLDNEANLAALAEFWRGGHTRPDGSPLRTFVHVSGEIGVGAGLVVDGQLFRGLRGFSGELGHLPIGPPGVPCSCGATGCLEQVAGQEAILRAAGLAGRGEAGTVTGAPDGPVGELVAAAGRGEGLALKAIGDAGTALGAGIAAVLNLVDADTVVLGGLYARLAPWLLPTVEPQVTRRTLSAAWSPVRVLISPLGGEAAVLGAALSVVRAVIADPAAHLVADGAGG